LKAHSCQNCIYLIYPAGGTCSVPVCINKADSPGQLHYTAPGGCCRNFKPKNFGRQKPPSPDDSGVRLIPLTQGKFAIVDADDYERLAKYKWHAYKNGSTYYASRTSANKKIIMHREIMQAPKGLLVDHIEGNGLNNRKSNLRLCTRVQNARNKRPKHNGSSRYKGVYWHISYRKWAANIRCNGKQKYLGRFDDEIEAAVAYDRKAELLFGEFAYLNFPQLTEFRKFARKIIFAA